MAINSVFPIGIPMIAGPGSIAAMLYMQNAGSDPISIGIVADAPSAQISCSLS